MTPSEAEFGALKERVARLEVEVAALRTGQTAPVSVMSLAPVIAAEAVNESPTLPPVIAAPTPVVRSVPIAKAAQETSSTVWIAAVGAVIFLIGAIYGLAVSIQRGWISPPVRVGAGMVVGAALVWGAARQLQRDHRGLGVALLAAGTGTWAFAWYFGTHGAQLFSLGVGLLGTAVMILGAGAIAARARSDGALAVALATGLFAPLAFSDGRGNTPGLLAWLAGLVGAQLLAHYLIGTGARWSWSRLCGVVGTWFVAFAGVTEGRVDSPALVIGLLVLLGVVVTTLAWLPGHPEKPGLPAAATVWSYVSGAWAIWIVWGRSGFEREAFAVVLVALALTSVGLVPFARRRTAGNEHDLPLWLLATGLIFVAVPVALQWKWVVLAWGGLAVLLAVATRAATQGGRAHAEALRVVTVCAALAASFVWCGLVLGQRRVDMIFVNRVFAGGVLAAVAWGILMSVGGRWRAFACVLLQLVAVNALAWELARAVPTVRSEYTALAFGPLLATLTYALTGAGLWLRGVRQTAAEGAKLLRVTGYGWLAIASVKLLASDLARTDLLFRAVAALGVGAILIAAAWWASQRRTE